MGDVSDEDFVSYGTPLEPVEDDGPRRKPVLTEEQIVTDEKGRRRFHGAFTGGFSAGYFNTVGSKQGWTPSTFLSSRGQRSSDQATRMAEDFMDDEDLGDFGIAPRKIVTTDKFTEQKAKKRSSKLAGVIPGDCPLQDLIVPNNETIGARILHKMGWRRGQGVGAKARRKKRRTPHNNELGPVPTDSPNDSEDDVDLCKDFLFAPVDVEEIAMTPKDDTHGIGYHGLDPTLAGMGTGGHVSLFEEPVCNRSGKRGIRGQAFGVGAFETAGDDIYTVDNMSNYDRVLGGEETGNGTYGWTAPRQGLTGKSSSGLDGFKAAAQGVAPNKVYPPPSLPRDFRPVHIWTEQTTDNEQTTTTAVSFKSNRFSLSATQRGAMLGEEQLPGPSSVFDLLSAEDRQNLKGISSTSQALTPKETAESQPPLRPKTGSRFDQSTPGSRFDQASVPAGSPTATDARRQWAAGGGYQPFASQPAKQRRYEEYVARRKTGQGGVASTSSDTLTEWERHREEEEFGRAASLYKPLSSIMASRFVSAKSNDDENIAEVAAEKEGNKCEQSKAADLKMYGKLTRTTSEWHPDNVLCRRFNVPNPYPGSLIVGLPTVKRDKFSVFNFLSVTPEEPAPPPTPPQSQTKTLISDKSSRWDQKLGLLANIGNAEGTEKKDDSKPTGSPPTGSQPTGSQPTGPSQHVADQVESRPPMDLFKAIFASSSDEDDEDSSSEDQGRDQGQDQGQNQDTRTKPSSLNPDLSSLNPDSSSLTVEQVEEKMDVKSPNQETDLRNQLEDEVYGPKLPPPCPTSQDTGPALSGLSEHPGNQCRSRDQESRKEQRRKRDERREHKRSKERKHHEKKKKKSKKKETSSKQSHKGHHRSSSRSRHQGHCERTNKEDYDASGSDSSSNSER